MNRTQEWLFLAIFVIPPLALAVLMLRLRFPWHAPVGGIGLTLLSGSWITMYRRVRENFPDHPLARADYMRPGLKDWNLGIRPVVFYFLRYGLDVRSALLLIGVAILLGLLVTGIGGTVSFRALRRLRLDRRLLREGTGAEAAVTAVTASRLRINGRRQWVVRYRYADFAGRAHKGRSGYLEEDEAAVWHEGAVGWIRYDPHRSDRSVWLGRAGQAAGDVGTNEDASPDRRPGAAPAGPARSRSFKLIISERWRMRLALGH